MRHVSRGHYLYDNNLREDSANFSDARARGKIAIGTIGGKAAAAPTGREVCSSGSDGIVRQVGAATRRF